MAFLIEITADHVRNPHTMGARTRHDVLQCLGRLLPNDIGKRCYRVGGVVQCENDEQLRARLARTQEQ